MQQQQQPVVSCLWTQRQLSLKYKIKQLAKCTKGYSFGVLFYVRENLDACFIHLQCQNVIVNDITNNINVWGDRLRHFFLDHVYIT
jgi:hypothetical protein